MLKNIFNSIFVIIILITVVAAAAFWIVLFSILIDQIIRTYSIRFEYIYPVSFAILVGLILFPTYLIGGDVSQKTNQQMILYSIGNLLLEIELAAFMGSMLGVFVFGFVSFVQYLLPGYQLSTLILFPSFGEKDMMNSLPFLIGAVSGISLGAYQFIQYSSGSEKFVARDALVNYSFLFGSRKQPISNNVRRGELEYYEEGETDDGKIVTITIFLLDSSGNRFKDNIFESILSKNFDAKNNPLAFIDTKGYQNKELLARLASLNSLGKYPWSLIYISEKGSKNIYDITAPIHNEIRTTPH